MKKPFVGSGVVLVFCALAVKACAETVDFDRGWEFALRDVAWLSYGKVGLCERPQDNSNDNGIPRVLADSNGWEKVTLPHDWALTLPLASKGTRNGFHAIGSGFPAHNVGWYRKRFDVPASYATRRVFVRFDGVYRDAQFWVNGIYLGRNDSGYIGRVFEITDFLKFGDANNTMAVRVDASKDEGWWYDGAGICRHVTLEVKEPDGLVPDTAFIRLKEMAIRLIMQRMFVRRALGRASSSTDAPRSSCGRVINRET